MTAEKVGMELLQEAQKDIYDFLCFLCEKMDDDYQSTSISMIKDWKKENTQLYGYKVIDNIKKDLREYLKDHGIPFVECDLNTEMSSCFIVPMPYVQQLETAAIQIAQQHELVAETSLDAVNDYCFGENNRERYTLQVTGQDVANRLLQNLSKMDYKRDTIIFNRELIDDEKKIYNFHFPKRHMDGVNRAFFQTLWELSGPMGKEIKQYDEDNLYIQQAVRDKIWNHYDTNSKEPLYIYDADLEHQSFIKITENRIFYTKDGVEFIEEHRNDDNEATHETLERWMDTLDIPVVVKESELDNLENIRKENLKIRYEYFKNDLYKADIALEQTLEQKLKKCFADPLNKRSVDAIYEITRLYDDKMQEINPTYQERADFIKETMTNSNISVRQIDSNDLDLFQRTRKIDRKMERKVDKYLHNGYEDLER